MAGQPDFSVIMPVCHGGPFLRKALDSMRAMEYDAGAFEILVSGRSGDEEARRLTTELKRAAPFRVEYAPCDAATRSALLNTAIASATGRILAFTDDDCAPPRSWLRDWRAALDTRPEAGAMGGSDELPSGSRAFDQALDWVLNSFVGTGGIRTSARGVGRYYPRLWNMAIPRAVALAAALPGRGERPQVFNESFHVNEDVGLVERIARTGKEVVCAPQVRVRHYRDTTLFSFLRRNFRMARVCRRLGLHRLPHTLLAGGALAVSALAVLSAWPGPWRMALAACVGAYALVLLGSALAALAAKRRAEMLFLVPGLLAGVHAARAAGFLAAWRDAGQARVKR
jgi:GT2 family glycosyltransferase